MRFLRLLIVILVLVWFNQFQASTTRAAVASKPAVVYGDTWFLRNTLDTGFADNTFTYGTPSMQKLFCAWDPAQPGVKLPVAVADEGGVLTWYLRNSYSGGPGDLTFTYGFSGATPVCGDWDGDGIDTPGVATTGSFRQRFTCAFSSTWYLRNSNSTGVADNTFAVGALTLYQDCYSAQPIVGDWDGDGFDTTGVIWASSVWYTWNKNESNSDDNSNPYQIINFQGVKPVAGDWDGNGTDTPGGCLDYTWYLGNEHGAIQSTFYYGFPGATPLAW